MSEQGPSFSNGEYFDVLADREPDKAKREELLWAAAIHKGNLLGLSIEKIAEMFDGGTQGIEQISPDLALGFRARLGEGPDIEASDQVYKKEE